MTEIPKRRLIRRVKKPENSQLKCNVLNCLESECGHFIFHDKNINCEKVCGVHKEAKCVVS